MEAIINRYGEQPYNLGTPNTSKTLWNNQSILISVPAGTTQTTAQAYTILQADVDAFGGKGAIVQFHAGSSTLLTNCYENIEMRLNSKALFSSAIQNYQRQLYSLPFDLLKAGDILTTQITINNQYTIAQVYIGMSLAIINYKT